MAKVKKGTLVVGENTTAALRGLGSPAVRGLDIDDAITFMKLLPAFTEAAKVVKNEINEKAPALKETIVAEVEKVSDALVNAGEVSKEKMEKLKDAFLGFLGGIGGTDDTTVDDTTVDDTSTDDSSTDDSTESEETTTEDDTDETEDETETTDDSEETTVDDSVTDEDEDE